jgi:hypothetical protein
MIEVILKRVDNYINTKESDRKALQKEKEQILIKLKKIRANKGKMLMKEAARVLGFEIFVEQTRLLHEENIHFIMQIAKICVLKCSFIFARAVTIDFDKQIEPEVVQNNYTNKENLQSDNTIGFMSFRSKFIILRFKT